MTITIAAKSAGLDFGAYLADYNKNFDRGDSRGAFNDTLFSGDEFVLSEDGDLGGDAADQGFIADGQFTYDFPTHSVKGTLNSLEFGHGAKPSGEGFGFTRLDILISGLTLKGAQVDAHLGALMEADVSLLKKLLSADSLRFLGSGGDDRFTAYGKNDALAGGAGSDVLRGGAGDDRLNGGTGNDKLYGDSGNDTLIGSSGDDTLSGGTGNDSLAGGSGADKLLGGAGADSFVFDTGLSRTIRDTILDFSVADDTVQLSDAIFKGLKEGKLAAEAFTIGAKATEADDRIIYDSNSGHLSFDADGSGAKAAIHFATLEAKLALTAADFLVV